MTVSFFPIFLIDFAGSILMIIFSFLCLRIVTTLRKRDTNNLIWTYLLWVCIGLACFAVSRSAGHILKNIFIVSGHKELWAGIRPFSGAVNSVMFIVVAAITLFYGLQYWNDWNRSSMNARWPCRHRNSNTVRYLRSPRT